MKSFLLEVRVSRTRRVHGGVRYVAFRVTPEVARAILDVAEAKKGLGVRSRAAAPTVQLEECAIWMDENYRQVRPMLLPNRPSIVTIHGDGTFALVNFFAPAMVSSERVSVERLRETAECLDQSRIVVLARQPELRALPL